MEDRPPESVEHRLARTEQLVHAAQQRDSGTLDELVEAHLPDLRAFVRAHIDTALRQRESVSDVVQSVCRDVVEDLHGFEYRGAGSFRAWLFTATLNKIRQKHEFWHAQKRDVSREVRAGARDTTDASIYSSLCAPEPTPSQHAAGAELRERIEQAIDGLKQEHREVLLLARIVGLSRREIGEQLGKSEGAVRALLGRASVHLLAELDGRN